MMSSVGEELRRERELRGIALEEISEETKIGIRFLEAIDADRLEIIPGEFYRRACLRSYASYLGLDADRIVATHQFRTAAQSKEPDFLPEHGNRARKSISVMPARWAALVLVALGISVVAVAIWPKGGTEEPPTQHAFRPPASVSELKADEHAGNVPAETVARQDVVADPLVEEILEEEPTVGMPLRLTFRVDEPCWLVVHADDILVVQGLMHEGFEKQVQASEEIRLWLGNAGGISIWINESPAKPLGRPGQVRKDVRITAENFAEFLASDGETEIANVPADAR
jgi:hypothetical protein